MFKKSVSDYTSRTFSKGNKATRMSSVENQFSLLQPWREQYWLKKILAIPSLELKISDDLSDKNTTGANCWQHYMIKGRYLENLRGIHITKESNLQSTSDYDRIMLELKSLDVIISSMSLFKLLTRIYNLTTRSRGIKKKQYRCTQ